MGKRATINDVARMAGVSKSTVSRFLNGSPVREETAKSIRRAIRHYRYESNQFARLNAKQSNIMGIILPGFDSTVTPRVMTAMDKYLRTKGYTPLIINTEGDLDLEVASITNLAAMNVDGIVIISTYITDAHREAVESIDKPVVFMGQVFEHGVSVLDDNQSAGRALGAYVAERGIRSAGLLWVDERDVAVGQTRRDAVAEGLRAGGVDDVRVYTADFTYPTAYAVARRVLGEKDRPEALLCATDRIAYGVYKAARELGVRIPEDVSVTGFGAYDTSEVVTPPLTTVRFDVESAACVCADTVLRMRAGEPVSKTQLIGYTFVEGESVRDAGKAAGR
ncbi:LacI family DNA-binding transcriptional regulator [Olsenella sp. An290]|uniref:LacI family DNA-binding transcriptional regulator n=1 Tax=Olsenella sp. An290 TaxID=1965625 RepID=UPI000B37C70A|nr:LacI family DNA-binding transcriptional regulator [Olsenella sp. An290]OUO34383.1 hypothetical protein B5F84_06680 [Olsenella sp. An290]